MNERVSQHTPSALAESPCHQLPALVYRLVAGLEQWLCQAAAAGPAP